jgi:hypothetical protein
MSGDALMVESIHSLRNSGDPRGTARELDGFGLIQT